MSLIVPTCLPQKVDREEIEMLTKELGGTYCKDLNRECTHLIAADTQSAKYERAHAWGLKIVRKEWFDVCVKSKGIYLE